MALHDDGAAKYVGSCGGYAKQNADGNGMHEVKTVASTQY
jgi:hypothetical protein